VSVAAGIVPLVGKVKRLFACSSCGRPSGQWAGRCPACGEWGTVGEQAIAVPSRAHTGGMAAPLVEDLSPHAEDRRISTGLQGVDRVLGGGLVAGSVVLLAGAPGIGKSTLLLQLASRLTDAGQSCLYASGEETRAQVARRARRVGLDGSRMSFVGGRELADVLGAVNALRPAVAVVDSVHTLRDEGVDAPAGGPSQVRACVDALVGLAKATGTSMLLVGHVTKAGDLAGPRIIEHAVDVTLSFEGDGRSGMRALVSGKNRFGSEGEVAWFEMQASGMVEREGGPGLLGGEREPGSATALVVAGRRGLAVDVQALVIPTEGAPRRQVVGLDARRFHVVAAVAERATRLKLVRSELIGSTVGGFRLEDHAADLALAAALVSAGTEVAVPDRTGFVGELSLTGAVRAVGSMERRLQAALAAGLEQVMCARAEGDVRHPDLRIVPVGHVREAVAWAVRSRIGQRSLASKALTPTRVA
jgi:DNA repair protein RadA/Sms